METPKFMMTKFQTITLALLSFASISFAQAGDYLTSFEDGKAKAQKEKKSLLVKFTGSDWCPPCKLLQDEVFSKADFKSEVEKDFVVVVLDFPRKKELPEEEKKANAEVRDQYQVSGYPTVLLMDAQGKVYKRTGYQPGGVKPYLKMIKTSLKARRFR